MKKVLIVLGLLAVVVIVMSNQKKGASTATLIDRPEDVLVEYAANLSIVRGHLRSSLAGLDMGDYAIAELHTGHPQEEGNVATVIDELKRSDEDLAAELNNTFGALSEEAADGDSVAVENAMAVLDEAMKSVVPANKLNDLKFQSQVLVEMLESVKDQYAEGVSGASMTEESEYADAFGIYKEIRALYQKLSSKMSEADNQAIEQVFGQIDGAFQKVSLAGDIEPINPKIVSPQIDGVIEKLNNAAAAQ